MIEANIRQKIEDLIRRAKELDGSAGNARNSREVSICQRWITEALNIVERAVPLPDNPYRRKVETLARGSHGLVQAVHSIAAIFEAFLGDIDAGLIEVKAAAEPAVTNGNFANFRAVYDDLTDEVLRSSRIFLPDHLRNWFSRIDETPDVARAVSELQKLANADEWIAGLPTKRNLGDRDLGFPVDRNESLAMRLSLFRAAAEKKVDLGELGFQFLNAGSNINNNARAFVDQVFRPMASELRRYLTDKLSSTFASRTVEAIKVSPDPRASTTPVQAGLEAHTSIGSQSSLDLSVTRAAPSSAGAESTFARGLLERPADVVLAARRLSIAIAEQISQLNASKPNDPERLTQQSDFIAFLESIAAGLDDLANLLNQAITSGSASSPEPIFLGKAGEIAKELGAAVEEGLKRHRNYIVDCTIRFSVFGAGFLFLNACGVDGYIAGIVAALMNVTLPKSDTKKSE
jgi:hypothetical protein